jgi:pimeloyl-ACP methyl ester carboxylesterase
VPTTGYDPQRRADDVLDAITALDLQKPILVGSSCGGDILHTLGGQHPDRLASLVYLDAAEDPTLAMAGCVLPPVDRANLPQRVAQSTPVTFPEAGQRLSKEPPLDPAIRKAIVDDNRVRPEYARIRVPVLAIYRALSPERSLAEYSPKTDAERAAVEQAHAARRAILERWQRDLRTGVPDGTHRRDSRREPVMFLSHAADVVRELRTLSDTLQ